MLIFASTHIGHPDDIPARSLQILQSCDLAVFEEDRPARSFLKKAGIHRDYIKWNEHGDAFSLEEIRSALLEGKTVAYMSDQGTANLSDPGKSLAKLAFDLGIAIKVIPGPSSLTAALAACPFSVEPFYFRGFLPKKQEDRERELRKLNERKDAIVILDTPYRLKSILESVSKMMSSEREWLLARDISGEQEIYDYGTIRELKSFYKSIEGKLNFVLVLGSLTSPRK